jgi:hypothetical protein
MVHVRQKGLFDCGVAVAAIVAQVPYDTVLDRLIAGLSANSCVPERVLLRTLEDITCLAWRSYEPRKPRPRVGECFFPDSPTPVIIQRANGSRHYIVVCGDCVYDPLQEMPFVQNEYPGRDSWVATVFRPQADGDATSPSSRD